MQRLLWLLALLARADGRAESDHILQLALLGTAAGSILRDYVRQEPSASQFLKKQSKSKHHVAQLCIPLLERKAPKCESAQKGKSIQIFDLRHGWASWRPERETFPPTRFTGSALGQRSADSKQTMLGLCNIFGSS